MSPAFRPFHPYPRGLFALALAVCLSTSSGCRRDAASAESAHDHAQEKTHEHEGEHEPHSARITAWTPGHEVFIEHPAPAAGQATLFVTHVTRRVDWQPRAEGPLSFHLRQGATTLDAVQAGPTRPGIYEARLTFPGPGDWQLSLSIPNGDTTETADLGTLRVHPDPHEAEHQEFPEPPGGITFLKGHQWKIAFRVESASRTTLTQRLQIPARVRWVPGRAAHGVAPVSGTIEVLRDGTMPRPGQRVSAGQPLALLQPVFSETTARLTEAEGERTIAKASVDQAEAALARVKRLAADQAKSLREVQEAELTLATAQARHDAATRLLASLPLGSVPAENGQAARVPLVAPIAGVLDSVSAGPGETVSAGQPFCRVIDPSVLWIEARIPESRAGVWKSPGDALLETPGLPGQFAPAPGDGWRQPLHLGQEVDSDTRTVPLIYEVPNPEGRLRPGQWVQLSVAVGTTTNALVLPDSAIVEEAGQPLAFIQLDGETFEKRPVTLGIRDGNRIEVLTGLEAGDRVVTLGAYAVRLASLAATLPSHSHAH